MGQTTLLAFGLLVIAIIQINAIRPPVVVATGNSYSDQRNIVTINPKYDNSFSLNHLFSTCSLHQIVRNN